MGVLRGKVSEQISYLKFLRTLLDCSRGNVYSGQSGLMTWLYVASGPELIHISQLETQKKEFSDAHTLKALCL